MAFLTLGVAYAAYSHHPRDLASSTDPSDSLFTDRSIWNIIWSCFATIFACTWISVHPNIPAPNESAFRVIGRRLAIMFYLLIAPEMVIVWTTRQYLGASDIVKRHKCMLQASPRLYMIYELDTLAKGWTKVHAFFLIMGGFSLYENGVLVRTLETHEMEKLEEEGKIDWPTITEGEIRDKSKGDFFSKGVVIMQTTWFIIQCIVRGSKRMVLTELEVVTLAFAALTMAIYALWWHKPLDVQLSVPVHLKKGYSTDPEEEKGETTSSTIALGQDDDLQTSLLMIVEQPEAPVDVDVEAQDTELSHSASPEPVPDPPTARPYHDPSLSLPQKFRVYLKAKREELGFISSVIYVFTVRPGVIFFGAFVDMMFCTTLEGKQYRVPTFYAPATENDSMSIMLALLVAIVFGGIHCIAWSFEFPTVVEQWAWRVSAVLVSGLPISISFLSVFMDGGDEEYSSAWAKFVSDALALVLITSAMLYIAARVALLVLPLMALRALPAGAYVDLNWTVYLPHV